MTDRLSAKREQEIREWLPTRYVPNTYSVNPRTLEATDFRYEATGYEAAARELLAELDAVRADLAQAEERADGFADDAQQSHRRRHIAEAALTQAREALERIEAGSSDPGARALARDALAGDDPPPPPEPKRPAKPTYSQ